MEDDGSFTSDEVPEIAQAMAGQWVLYRRHFHRTQGGLCDRFLQRQADLLGAELTLAGDNRHNGVRHNATANAWPRG